MRIRRYLLEQVALASATRPQLHHVVVALYEGHHPQQDGILGSLGQCIGFQANRSHQKIAPLLATEVTAGLRQNIQHIALRHLDRSQLGDAKGIALLFGNHTVVFQGDLGIKATGQQPLVVINNLVGNTYPIQVQAWQAGQVTTLFFHEPHADNIDQLGRAILVGPSFEQLLFAGAHSARGQLTLHNLKPLFDLLGVGGGAIAAQHKFDHIGRYRKLAGKGSHQILADQVTLKGCCGLVVQRIHFHLFVSYQCRLLRQHITLIIQQHQHR
ncbi:hypothetical protein FQZ97_444040 [compost metagenome]